MADRERGDSKVIDWSISFAIALRSLRKRVGLSQGTLGRLVGKNQSFISQMENGRRLPSLNTFFELAEALDVEPKDLLEVDND